MNSPAIEKNIFKAYDIRGIVGESLDLESVENIGRSVGSEAISQKQSTICVGYDGRLSSPDLCQALIKGLLSTGIKVVEIGLVTTPMLYFSTHLLETNTGIMITGSHNPPDYNGFKIMIAGETISSEKIQSLYQRIINNQFLTGIGSSTRADIQNQYLTAIYKDIKVKRPIKITIDCGNGAGGICAEELYKGLGAEVTALYCDVDGNFPNHHPDPSNPDNLIDLQNNLASTDSEIGLAFDGDADRLGVVTKSGEIIYPDRQLLLFAESVLKDHPGATVIFDVKSTKHLFKWIEDKGGIPLIWKTGHSLIKKKMKEVNAVLAGEMSGHTFFNDKWYGFDDGLYAGARLLEILSNFDDPSAILEALPKSVSTPELNIKLEEGEQHKIIQQLQEEALFSDALNIIKIDGLRVEYANGFGLMRASNTTPVIVLRFEAESSTELNKIQKDFKIQLEKYINTVRIPF
ncbi:MAG: phosphoglucomutase [Methylophilales bacterium BACL14 MAG-120910-bin43]|jgi:phosphomannomutase/phosphoglucomutase|nr:MAG: phosphoglucomutase [Methylophilales bacterium BACL14 MAG-120910-bin43]|tara:strand:+ start:158 stop:1540 length:1383 start_codon:yes stop_codon:yes gene_type:complete